jgi:hypothetical protein
MAGVSSGGKSGFLPLRRLRRVSASEFSQQSSSVSELSSDDPVSLPTTNNKSVINLTTSTKKDAVLGPFLDARGLHATVPVFEDQEIDMDAFVNLTTADLPELGKPPALLYTLSLLSNLRFFN